MLVKFEGGPGIAIVTEFDTSDSTPYNTDFAVNIYVCPGIRSNNGVDVSGAGTTL
jgi:hypothetical protein